MDEELKKAVFNLLEQHQEYIKELHERLRVVEEKLYDAQRALEIIQRNKGNYI